MKSNFLATVLLAASVLFNPRCGFASTTTTPLARAHHAQLAQQTTVASWYGAECEGRPMANGKPFVPSALTCASWDYPLGTKLRVTHNARSVVVTVTDRGPARRLYKQGRELDLSRAAFGKLASHKVGLIKVNVQRLNK